MRSFKQSMVLGTLSILAFAANSSLAEAQTCTPAFPGVEGAGRCAAGGRGGDVYVVTEVGTTPSTTPGTLGYGLANAPPAGRIIVFAKSGVIDLTKTNPDFTKRGGSLEVLRSKITIAGQTAPGDGITITGGRIYVNADDVIVRHIRSRRGVIQYGVDNGDAIEIGDMGVAREKQVFDHVSASWGTDENLSMMNTRSSTLQWNLIAEGLNYNNAAANPPEHGFGSIWSANAGSEASFFHTLYAHNNRRHPHFGNYSGTGAPKMDFRNNVVYDWKEFPSHTNGGMVFNINFVNNYFKPGPSTIDPSIVFEFDPPSTGTKMYSNGNLLDLTTGVNSTTSSNMSFPIGTTWTTFKADNAFAPTTYNSYTPVASGNFQNVLDQAGTILPARDQVDQRIVDDVRNRTGNVILTESDVAGSNWKTGYYESIPAPIETDTTNDGLPDFWETQFGTVTLVANGTGANTDNDIDGYVNIEEYINNTIPITIPTATNVPAGTTLTPKDTVVYVGAMDSRAKYGSTTEKGKWRIYRSGPTTAALPVRFTLSSVSDLSLMSTAPFTAPTTTTEGTVTIPVGSRHVDIELTALTSSASAKQVILQLATTGFTTTPSNYVSRSISTGALISTYPYFVGCPSQSLISIKKP